MTAIVIHHRITIDPSVMLGKPVVAGTRMPVYLIDELLQAGHSPEQVVSDYPELTLEDVEAAATFVADERLRTESFSL